MLFRLKFKIDAFRLLPRIDLSHTWTDAELYQYFDLTQEEINYIEENTK